MKKINKNEINNNQNSINVLRNKKILIIIGTVLVLVVIFALLFCLNKKETSTSLPKENNTILKDDVTFEEKAIEGQKNILLDILNQEIAKYEEICIDEDNNECITAEEKEEILNNFNSFKERLENEEVSQENIELLKQEINDYLVTLDPEVKLDDLISEEVKDKEATTINEEESNASASVGSGIESILNSAKLNPIKIGFVIGEEIDSLMNTYGFYEKDAIQVFLASNGFGTKKGSCDNYSAMFMVLTRRIGLDSYVISARNTNGTGHTTVNIKINGKWYNFDPQREDNSLKNGKIMYYAFGEDDNDSKPYTYVNRNSDVSAFHAFAKQPESNYLKATITVGGKSYTAKTAVSGYKYVIPDTIEINYATNPTTYINIETSHKVDYIHTMSDNSSTNYVWETVSGDRGTINTSGTISITQKWGALRYEIIHLEDDLGRELNFVFRVNYRDPNKQFTIEHQGGDISYTDYVDLIITTRDSVGEVTLSGKVIETNDPKGASAIVVEKSPFYDLRVSNLDRTKYYYVVEITGIDEAGNKATDIANITVKVSKNSLH